MHLAQFLAGVFILIYLGILILLARGERGGVIGAICTGIFLALAGILKHIPLIIKPGPYWRCSIVLFMKLVALHSPVWGDQTAHVSPTISGVRRS